MHWRPTNKAVIQICSWAARLGHKANSGKRNFLLGECLTIADIQLRDTSAKYFIHWRNRHQIALFLAAVWRYYSSETFLLNFFFHIKFDKPHLKAEIVPCRPRSTDPDVDLSTVCLQGWDTGQHVIYLWYSVQWNTARKKVSPGTQNVLIIFMS
jgi:hypothetical protein